MLVVLTLLALFTASPVPAQDGTAPTLSSAVVTGDDLVLTFSEKMVEVVPAAASFKVMVDGVAAELVYNRYNPNILDNLLLFVLAVDVQRGQTVTLSYTEPQTDPLRDGDGNRVASFADFAVSNTTPDQAVFESAEVNGSALTITFDDRLNQGSVPAAGAFTVTVNGKTRTVSKVALSRATVKLTLSSAVTDRDEVKVRYAKPVSNPLRNTVHVDTPTFGDQAVTNNSPDTTAPEFSSASVDGDVLQIVFDEHLNPLLIEQGAFSASVNGTDREVRRLNGIGGLGLNVVLLELRQGVASGDAVTLSYTRPAATRYDNPLQDAHGNKVESFSDRPVTNLTPPALESAWVNGAALTLTFDTALDTGSVPARSAFVVTVGTARRDVAAGGVAVSGSTVTLTLASTVTRTDTVKVRYRKPDAGPLQDARGNKVNSFYNRPVSHGEVPSNSPPAFAASSVSLSIAENHAVGASVGTVAASDANGDALSYTLGSTTSGDTDHESFTISSAGEIKVASGVTLNHESQSSYSIMAEVTDRKDAQGNAESGTPSMDDTVDVTITVTNVEEPPGAPTGLTVRGASNGTSLEVSWTAPVVSGALAVSDYDVRYFKGSADPSDSADWIEAGEAGGHDHVGVATTATLRGLDANSDYRVQVRAKGDGAGVWSATAGGATVANDAAPARLESAATEPRGRGLVLTFTGDLLIAGDHRDYTVVVDGERRSTRLASWDGNTVALVLQEPVRWGETVTVAYAKHSGRVALRDVDRLAVESFGPVAVSNTVAQPVNSPATGAPAIAGTARVGETLTASTSDIADADGLAGASFAFQWVSNGGGVDADIAGATGARYTLTEGEEGRAVKVRATFTDDAGNRETRMSAATAAVAARLRPLTASFVGLPSEHDGRRLFSFELRFSDNFPGRLSYKVLRDEALQVTGGHVREAKRTPRGQNRSWEISVRPSSYEEVTVRLPAGSVQTHRGRTLSSTVEATVRGPALLSVADAEAREGQDAAVSFAVTLSRQASTAVTVDYATADGTATAGEDYTATSGTLTFAVGETRKTVAVAIHDDAIDEGRETFTLTLSSAVGAAILDGDATGTIDNDDPMPRAWTARFGRTVAVHVVDAVQARLDGAAESYMQLGGHRLGGGSPDVQETVRRLAPQRDPGSSPGQALWDEADTVDPAGQTMTFRDLLLGSAFHLVSNGEDEPLAPRLSAWGRVATSGFDGRDGEVSLEGSVTTATLGVDGVWKRWLTGLVLAYSDGDGSFSHAGMAGGNLTSSLTSVHPYVSYTLSDRVRLWGLAGYGSGALRLDLDDRSPMDADLTMTMGALGVRGTLVRPSGAGGLEVALRSDVLWMGMDSAAAHDLAATEAEASRLRLVLEGSRPVALAGGGRFVPTLELGLRHDGGDAETGSGLEVGGRLLYASAWGLSIEASVRALVAHEAADYQEWGAAGAVRFDPGRQGKGFTASIVPAWGMAGSGMGRLWEQQTTAGLAPADALVPAAAGRVEAELGYGLAALQGRGLLTPYARVALTEGTDQAWHLGARLALAETLNLSLEASRRARQGEAAAHDVALLANLGF